MNVNLFSCFRIKYVGSKPYLGSKAYMRHSPLDSFRGFLVLSSDGLYQHMQPSELPQILYPSAAAPADKEQSTAGGDGDMESSTRCRGVAKRLLDEALVRATTASRKWGMLDHCTVIKCAVKCTEVYFTRLLCRVMD